MQLFEVIELREFPYFLTVQVEEGELVKDILTEINNYKVFIMVDHDTKRIWTYNGPYSSLKLQIYGGILAGMLRTQLRMFYRVYTLNEYNKEDKEFQEILEKSLGQGRARNIEKSDFSEVQFEKIMGDLIIHSPRFKQAMDNINSYPLPRNFTRIFMIIGGIIYSEEEITEAMLKEVKISKNVVKMGRLNNGFTFFDDRNYSTRLIIKDRAIQAIELFVDKSDKPSPLKVKPPLILDDKLSKTGRIEDILRAFKIPDSISDLDSTENHD